MLPKGVRSLHPGRDQHAIADAWRRSCDCIMRAIAHRWCMRAASHGLEKALLGILPRWSAARQACPGVSSHAPGMYPWKTLRLENSEQIDFLLIRFCTAQLRRIAEGGLEAWWVGISHVTIRWASNHLDTWTLLHSCMAFPDENKQKWSTEKKYNHYYKVIPHRNKLDQLCLMEHCNESVSCHRYAWLVTNFLPRPAARQK